MENVTTDNERKFSFVVHFVETWNLLLPMFRFLNDNPNLGWVTLPLWPICFLVSIFFNQMKSGNRIIDTFRFGGISGETRAINNFAWQFMIRRNHEKIVERICGAVLDAQEAGATTIGLGALVKAEWLTQGGTLVLKRLGDKLKVPLVHGDTLTAAVVSRQAMQIINSYGLEKSPVFIVGATSKIGRATALWLVQRGVRVRMLTGNRRRFQDIYNEVPEGQKHLMEHALKVKDGRDCLFWITGKADPKGKKLVKYLPYGAVVLNFSVPDPLSRFVLWGRIDVRHFDGGMMVYDPTKTTMWNRIRLMPGSTYACHAGTIVHALMGWMHHEVGPVIVDQMDHTYYAALRAGFSLSRWTSFLRSANLPPSSIRATRLRDAVNK